MFDPAISLDFDGVIHKFTTPWDPERPNYIADGPVEGAKEAIEQYLEAGLRVYILTCRANNPEGVVAVREWLEKHGFPQRVDITASKPWSILYVDDRGYHFKGTNFPTVDALRAFRPWMKTTPRRR